MLVRQTVPAKKWKTYLQKGHFQLKTAPSDLSSPLSAYENSITREWSIAIIIVSAES